MRGFLPLGPSARAARPTSLWPWQPRPRTGCRADASDPSARRPAAGTGPGREEQPGDEGEVVDEEAELRLVDPKGRAIEGEGQEQHIDRGQEGGLGEEH